MSVDYCFSTFYQYTLSWFNVLGCPTRLSSVTHPAMTANTGQSVPKCHVYTPSSIEVVQTIIELHLVVSPQKSLAKHINIRIHELRHSKYTFRTDSNSCQVAIDMIISFPAARNTQFPRTLCKVCVKRPFRMLRGPLRHTYVKAVIFFPIGYNCELH